MPIAVTGASGFVARNLIALLREGPEPVDVRPLVRERAGASELPRRDGGWPQAREIDVRRPETLRGAFDGCEAVVHTVAVPTERRASFAEVNAAGTRNVVAEAERAGVRRLVHLSAIGASAASPYPFLRSKGEGQEAVAGSRIPSVVLRPSLLFGPGDDFFPRLGFALRFPLVPVAGDGKARFQPLHVGDLAQALLAALRRDDVLGVHEIGGPEVLTYDELVAETMRGYGIRRPTIHLPVPLMKPPAIVMGLVMADPPVTSAQLDLLAVDNTPRENAIERMFHVKPRSIRGALGYLREGHIRA
ncbi:MAG: NAD-dependent epimerase/dehydratase family protein [Candidatus Limnocylindria bacterium]